MRGHIHKRVRTRADGTKSVLYYAVVDVPAEGGRRKQDWGRGSPTRREAEAELIRKVAAVTGNAFVAPQQILLRDYLLSHWLPAVGMSVKPSTAAGYAQVVRDYLVPHIGTVKLQALNVAQINGLYRKLLESGGKGQKKKGPPTAPGPLSPKTVRNVHLALSKALNDAVAEGLLLTNPATKAVKVRDNGTTRQIPAWSAQELQAFLSGSRGRYRPIWHLAAHTGMRRSELLGLRWSDLDAGRRLLTVQQTLVLVDGKPAYDRPKNGKPRTIDLDENTVSVLHQWRKAQIQERLSWGSGYEETGLVFTRESGTLIHPDRLSQVFDREVRDAPVGRIPLHGLRHTHATLLLKAQVPVKVVAERLGHSDPAFTIRVYQHVLQGMQSEAASLFASVVRNAAASHASGAGDGSV